MKPSECGARIPTAVVDVNESTEIKVNPRMVCWAKANDIDLEPLLNRDPDEDIPCLDSGLPWTVEFLQWIQGKWRTFHVKKLHGLHSYHECLACTVAATNGDFDIWLKASMEDTRR